MHTPIKFLLRTFILHSWYYLHNIDTQLFTTLMLRTTRMSPRKNTHKLV